MPVSKKRKTRNTLRSGGAAAAASRMQQGLLAHAAQRDPAALRATVARQLDWVARLDEDTRAECLDDIIATMTSPDPRVRDQTLATIAVWKQTADRLAGPTDPQ